MRILENKAFTIFDAVENLSLEAAAAKTVDVNDPAMLPSKVMHDKGKILKPAGKHAKDKAHSKQVPPDQVDADDDAMSPSKVMHDKGMILKQTKQGTGRAAKAYPTQKPPNVIDVNHKSMLPSKVMHDKGVVLKQGK